MKAKIAKLIVKALKERGIDFPEKGIEEKIEIPPTPNLGDYAFPCFFLAATSRENPVKIANDLKNRIEGKTKEFEKIEVKGAYLNFFLDKRSFAEKTVKEILKKKENYGKIKEEKKTIMVEFVSPNTNKPLHLGHLRNMSLGESITRIYQFNGNKVIKSSINNDRGIHISKSMLAYMKWGKNQTPEKAKKKSDHLVGDYYVLYSKKEKENPDLENEARELLKKWENGDEKTIALWKKMNKWALDGFRQTYKTFGTKIDKDYYESKIYKYGKEIVEYGLKKGIFKKRDGAVMIDLDYEGLGEKVVLRADGTSLYITQDLYLAKKKFDDYKLDESVYVTANEQDYQFKALFKILEKLNYLFAHKLKHVSYGLVNLPEGRMKSREGTVIDADDLIKQIQELAKENIEEKEKLSKKEINKRSLQISLAAIKYFLLKVDKSKNMVFNPKESIGLEGDTGPYLLYSYARASSILRKAKKKSNFKIKELTEKERELVNKLSQFPEIVLNAYRNLNPSLIANYSYELAQKFNEFYHSCKVIGDKNENFRLNLVESFKYVLKNSLNLLGIETVEKM